MNPPTLRHTPLYLEHKQLGARFIPFSGWEMPVSYRGIVQEHQAVRQRAGIFDISHMGRFCLRGSQVEAQLSRLVPTDLRRLPIGQGQYTVLLTELGGIRDDLILYKQPCEGAKESWLGIVNAATAAQDQAWILENIKDTDIEFQDLGNSHLLLAVQGSESLSLLQPIIQESLASLKRFHHAWVTVLSPHPESMFIARTGYTGEDGFELMPSPEAGVWIWQHLVSLGIQPCGLGCRDTLRLEAALHLYGQDITAETTPLEAGLRWLITSRDPYVGREALKTQEKEGISRQLVGIRMKGREIPRPGYRVFAQDQQVGALTSGSLSITLGYGIGLVYLPPDLTALGTEVEVDIRGKRCLAEVVKRPFYRSAHPAPR
jgi:aminomethyltransferase